MSVEVTFDKSGKVRVLAEEKYEQTKQLQEQTAAFSNSKFIGKEGRRAALLASKLPPLSPYLPS